MSEKVIRCGYVSAVDPDRGYVQMTYPDLDDAVSDWLPMMTNGSEYRMPKIGQQMVALHLPNGQDSGFVLGGYWSDDDIPESTGEGVFRKDLGGGCYLECKDGTLTIHASTIKIEADNISIDGSTVNIGRSGTITGLKVAGCSGCGG